MLSEKLRECRELCNYSQQQVAECLNIDRSTYSYYESGRTEPSIDNLKRIAKLFGVKVNELLEVDTELSDSSRTGEPDAGRALKDSDGAKLNNRVGNRVGDLSREEQRLIMRFRMLTDNQRRDIMQAMSVFDYDDSDPQKNN